MDILAAIKREERKLEKQLGKLQHKLNGVQAAAKASAARKSASCPLPAEQRW
jgi:ribosome-associated translation inhibitor RaiA